MTRDKQGNEIRYSGMNEHLEDEQMEYARRLSNAEHGGASYKPRGSRREAGKSVIDSRWTRFELSTDGSGGRSGSRRGLHVFQARNKRSSSCFIDSTNRSFLTLSSPKLAYQGTGTQMALINRLYNQDSEVAPNYTCVTGSKIRI